jgi:hypothetical protein
MTVSLELLLAQQAADPSSNWLLSNLALVIGIAVVAAGVILGLPDLLRLNPKRVWAISSVGFRESIRRRVLWVTPLAMVGIVAVTQLAHPVDEQDAIRQATKYCLFASGVVVVVATLILACTSLPKEIDNRVIYTIVTKPATRLEIVLGKTLGFARTAAAILLVMGAFSYLYLHLTARQLQASVQERLRTLPATDTSRLTLQQYAEEGLLQARTYARPVGLGFYARVPQAADPIRWVTGSSEQSVAFPFDLPAELFAPDVTTQLNFRLQIAYQQPRPLTRREIELDDELSRLPASTTRPAERRPGKPRITASIQNRDQETVLPNGLLVDTRHAPDPVKKSTDPQAFRNATSVVLEDVPGAPPGVGEAELVVRAREFHQVIQTLPQRPDGKRRIHLFVTGQTPATRYGYAPGAVSLTALVAPSGGGDARPVPVPPATDEAGAEVGPRFRGRLSTTNAQQLRGDPDPNEAPVAVYQFRSAGLAPGGETVPFEFRTRVERGDVDVGDAENTTTVEVVVRNRKTGQASPSIAFHTDSDRPTYFRAPAGVVAGGEFDVELRSSTAGHYVGLRPGSLAVVASTQSFALNLLKSLSILWLLSVLVVVIAIFCSTFVSWPIAIVLSLVLLLGRWCVVQLGEPSSPRQMAVDFFGAEVGDVKARVFTDTFGALSKLLNVAAGVLPDLDQFRVTADIERGVTIPLEALVDPLRVLTFFGVPLLFLAYLFLRKKEVAP